MDHKRAIAALGALAQETRLELFRLLVARGPEGLPAGVIAERLRVLPASLSFHLQQLVHAGLIVQRRSGRQLIYSAEYDAMNALMAYLTENCCGRGAACAPVCNPAEIFAPTDPDSSVWRAAAEPVASARPYNVLFLCTGNSARSILAEALLSHWGKGGFRAFSAGSFPRGAVHPSALELLESVHLPTDGLRSKSWDEFAVAGAPRMDFVFTVCDRAASELCPVWPGSPVGAHWGVPDPAAVEGSPSDKRHAFRAAYLELESRIKLFAALPLDKLDRLAIARQIDAIGRVEATPEAAP
jgi:arsenate reductase